MVTKEAQIRFTDIDMLGHVSNIVIQQYYDIGKMGYFVDVMGMPFLWKKEAFIVVKNCNTFIEEIRADERILITTRVIKVGSKSLSFAQEIVNAKTLAVKSQSESIMVAFDLEARQSIEIHKHWRDRIEKHESSESK